MQPLGVLRQSLVLALQCLVVLVRPDPESRRLSAEHAGEDLHVTRLRGVKSRQLLGNLLKALAADSFQHAPQVLDRRAHRFVLDHELAGDMFRDLGRDDAQALIYLVDARVRNERLRPLWLRR